MSIVGGRSVRPGCDLRAANTGSGDLLLLNGWTSELGLYLAGDDVGLIVGQQPRPAAMPSVVQEPGANELNVWLRRVRGRR